MRLFIAVMLLVGGVIHLLPVAGVLGAERLFALYGVPVTEPNLTILLRHRAVLFGLIGGLVILSIFKPALQPLAFGVGLLSVISFLYIAFNVGQYNPQLSRVVAVDVIALACLVAGSAAYAYMRLRQT